MRKYIIILLVILVCFPFCLLVWAGLDAAGGSLINCRTVQSDTTTLTLNDNTSVSGHLTISMANPALLIKNTGTSEESAHVRFYDDDTAKASIRWNEDANSLRIISKGSIFFGENIWPDPYDEKPFGTTDANTFIIDTANYSVGIGTAQPSEKLHVKASGDIGSFVANAVLDDLTPGGRFNGIVFEDISYKVEIDANGTPDTFKWSDDGGSTWDATGVSITGAAQTLNNGITVTFTATDGHTTGDYWTWTLNIRNPMIVQNAAGDGVMWVGNNSRVGIGTESPATIFDVNGTATIDTLTLASGSITDSGGAISFGNENLTTTGQISTGSIVTTDSGLTGEFASIRVDNIYINQATQSGDLIISALDFSITADRILSVDLDDAARTLTISGNSTLNDWFDQSVKVAASPTFGGLTVDSNSIRVTTAKTPANSADTGNEGEICWDIDYVYVCVASNNWKRFALTSWGGAAENIVYAGEDVIYAGEYVVYP